MPEFLTLNSAAFVRPGAVVMAEVQDAEENRWPALVVQRFGKGRTAALCVGDFWRWRLSEGLQELHGLDGPVAGVDLDNGSSSPPGTPNEDLADHARQVGR